ncbi:MAG TPA: hypothetical protein VGR28_06190 [Candidatus Thermoplasmatota archaeon]|nr:hypothetical protein [Candidatus Thermoplasmatota archaeon]
MARREASTAAAVGPCVLSFGGILSQQACVVTFVFDTAYYPGVFAHDADAAASEFALWLLF